ncbi:MAG: hypothetical protein E7329_07140 [Clostridiales bacterium]|nr:hypothetical protein [Clostridiales bacterium]
MTYYIDPAIPQWKGNLHTHTTCSDGRKSPEEVVKLYEEAGYHFLALTDHRKVTPTDQLDTKLLMLPGVELDYFVTRRHRQAVHIVGIGVDDTLMETEGIRETPQQGIDGILAHGGLAILAHPAWSLNEPEVIEGLRGISATEIFNQVSQAPWNGNRADSSSVLDLCFADGCNLPVLAGDDAHFYNGDQCQSFLYLSAPALTREHVMDALKNGRFYASQGPVIHEFSLDGDTVSLKCSEVEQVIFYSNMPWVTGRTRRCPNITEDAYKITPNDTFVRAEITDRNGKKAWTMPVFVNR